MRLQTMLCLLPRRIMAGVVGVKTRCLQASCLLLLAFAAVAFLVTVSNSDVYISSVRNVTIDLESIQRDAIDTILIEHEDGAAYIAFQIPQSSNIVKQMKGGPYSVVSKRLVSSSDKPENRMSGEGSSESKQTSLRKIVDTVKVDTIDQNQVDADVAHVVQDNPYNIVNKQICSKVQNLTFVILVHTATTNFLRRRSIRETWANHKLFKKHNIRTVFLLGKPEKDSTQILIEHENFLHADLVQGTFRDTYRNLTHKAVLGIRWISEHCTNTKIVVKVDDDVFVNVFQMMDEVLSKYSKQSRSIFCNVRPKGTSPIERKKGKWKIKETEFFNMTHYPFTHCNGFFTVVTTDIVPEMYKAAKSTPFFWIDDVYLYGILPQKIGNVTFSALANLNLDEKRAIDCFESNKTKCKMVVANAHTDGVMDKLWYRALELNTDLAAKYATDGLL